MTTSILVLADDLTGAADCAARCRKAGLAATIFLDPPTLPLPGGVVAFTSDSRHLPPQEARQRVTEVASCLAHASDVRWYKKIDSTLRGNIGAELDALLSVLKEQTHRRSLAIVCPAFPAQRRGLRMGKLAMEGSAPTLFLPDLIAEQAKHLQIAVVSLPIVRSSRANLAKTLRHAQTTDSVVVIIDAINESDLEEIVLALEEATPDALLCGSAGLIGAWARRLVARQRELVMPPPPLAPVAAGTVAVIGSGSTAAQRQIATAHKTGAAQILVVEADANPQEAARAADRSAGRWLLHLPAPSPSAKMDGPAARHLAEHLAQFAEAVIERVTPGRLIVSGGDTATCVLQRLGVTRLEVVTEVQPGMPLTVGVDLHGQPWQILLKAGNHGNDGTLVDLLSDFSHK